MKQSMNLLDCQKELLDVIGRINRNSKDIEKGLAGQTDVILLVGDTGSGKSTIFNLLCGAEFEFVKEGAREILQVKKGTKNYSKMKHGTKSITTEPIYHYLKKINHLLIDFPGFKDTRGEIEELVIQLLFNKLVTKNKVKLVYIVQHPLADLPNRGTFVQDFLKIFSNQKFSFSDSALLCNSFSQEHMQEKDVIANVKEQLFTITKDPQQSKQNIYVLRIVTNKRLAEMPMNRDKLLQDLVKQKPIKFTPFKVDRVEIISKYLQKTSKVLTDSIFDCLQNQITNEISKSQNEVLVRVQVILRSFSLDPKQTVVQKYEKLFQLYHELSFMLKTKQNISSIQIASFFKIYQFFQEFSDQIDGYQECAEKLQRLYDIARLIDKQIEQKLQSSNLEKEHVKQLKQQQQDFKQQYDKMQENVNQQMAQVREEEKKIREEQINQMRQQNEQQIKQLQKQLEESQKNKGGFFEQFLDFAGKVLPAVIAAVI